MARAYEETSGYPVVHVGTPISDVVEERGDLSDEQIGNEVMERLRAANRKDAWNRLRIWPRNLLYFYGEQDLQWNAGERRWIRKIPSRRQKRYKANTLGTRGDHYISDLTQSDPSFIGVPENTDLAARATATLGTRVLMDDWYELNCEAARSIAVHDSWLFGSGFIEIGHDPNGGDVDVEYEPDLDGSGLPKQTPLGTPQFKQDRQGKPKIKNISRKGEFFARPVSPFLVFTPPQVELPLMEACPWVIRIEWATEYQIRKMADNPKELTDEHFSPEFSDPEFQYIDQLLGYSNQVRERPSEGLHLVVHYYELRCGVKGFERGKHYIVVADRKIAEGPLQSKKGNRYPLYLFAGRIKSKSFWSHAPITDAIEIQAGKNQVKTHALSWLEKFALPNILAPKGSGVPETLEASGQTYWFNPSAGPPQWWVPPPPNQAIFAMMQQMDKEMDDVLGDYPASRGQAVSAPSALYISYLQDASTKRIGRTIKQHAWSYARMGEGMLELHELFDNDDRLLTVIGRGNKAELVRMKKGTPLGDVRLRVQESSMMSVIPAARVEQARGLIKDQLFNPQIVPPQYLKPLLSFMKQPDLVDIDIGTGETDRFVDRVLTKLIEENQQVQPDPLWGPQNISDLSDGLDRRIIAEDRDDWDQGTVQRVMQFKQMLTQQTQQAKQQAQQEQLDQAKTQVTVQNALEMGKATARAAEKTKVLREQAKADVIKGLASPSAPSLPPNSDNGNGAGAPPPQQAQPDSGGLNGNA